MNDENFKITCLKCGEEIIISKTDNRSYTTKDSSIEIGGNYDGFTWIDCSCGNGVKKRRYK